MEDESEIETELRVKVIENGSKPPKRRTRGRQKIYFDDNSLKPPSSEQIVADLLLKAAKNSKERSRPQEVSLALDKIITAIANEEPEGLAYVEKMKNPEFKLEPESQDNFSAKLSKAFAVVSKRTVSISNQKAAKVSVEKRQETANNFAEGLYDIIEKIKSEENCSTYRQVVDALNKKDILSPNGKKWGTGSLKALYVRWEKLGISGNTPRP